jgi:hypothetical protein
MCSGITGAEFPPVGVPCWGATGRGLVRLVVEVEAGALPGPLFEAAWGVWGKAPMEDAPFMACRVGGFRLCLGVFGIGGRGLHSREMCSSWFRRDRGSAWSSSSSKGAREVGAGQEHRFKYRGRWVLLCRRFSLLALWCSLHLSHSAGAQAKIYLGVLYRRCTSRRARSSRCRAVVCCSKQGRDQPSLTALFVIGQAAPKFPTEAPLFHWSFSKATETGQLPSTLTTHPSM